MTNTEIGGGPCQSAEFNIIIENTHLNYGLRGQIQSRQGWIPASAGMTIECKCLSFLRSLCPRRQGSGNPVISHKYSATKKKKFLLITKRGIGRDDVLLTSITPFHQNNIVINMFFFEGSSYSLRTLISLINYMNRFSGL